METTPLITVSVKRSGQDKRFDAALFALLEKEFPGRFSRSSVGRVIREGRAFRNGSLAKPSTPVFQGDILSIEADTTSEDAPLQPNTDIQTVILAETADYIAIDKPAGLQVHPGNHDTGDTLANWIIATYPETAAFGEDPLRPGIVHRLDRDTSGVMMIAKTEKGFDELKHVFHDRLAEKTYIALVSGHLSEQSGTIDRALGQRSGELRRRTDDGTIPNARPALTDYRVIARYADCDLVAAMPKTGRTHQIRAHMAALGHPIIGDHLYSNKLSRQKDVLSAPRHMLHAWRLSLPLFGQKVALEAPLPEDFRKVMKSIDETRETSYDDEALESLLLS